MISLKVEDVRLFMNALLRQSVFDSFQVREIKLNTLARFTISGEVNKAFLSEEEKEARPDTYLLWQDLKETCFYLIKGKKLPSLFQITLAFPRTAIPSDADTPLDQVESFLLNIHFEENILHLITATSMKTFTMDRSAERYWDGFAVQWLKDQGIETEQE